ncbi:hypothetical protein WME76_11810 [Sorangium sp. So ce119]|uniref:hypothetical protein n=1 Tax=Sorangium sp. So ce119 TaxID=3133279 RepID=UPI003F613375
MQRPFLFNIVLLSLLLGAPASAAEPARRVLRLQYSEDARAASCPGEAGLREQIQARTGYDPFREDAPEDVAVTIVHRGADLVATVKYRDPGGNVSSQREFDVPSSDAACGLLTSYVALSIAFALTPFGLDERAPAAAAPAEVALPATPRARQPAPRPAPAIAPDRPLRSTQLGVGALARVGVTGEVLGGFSCSFRSRLSRSVTLALESRNVFPAFAPDARTGGAGADQGASSPAGGPAEQALYTRAITSGAIASCFHLRDPLVGCGLVEAGTLLLSGQPGGDLDAILLMMALGVRGGAEVALSDTFSFYAHGELLAAFRLQDATAIDALRTPRLTASVGAGLLAGF